MILQILSATGNTKEPDIVAPPEEKEIVQALLEGMIVKYQTKQTVGGLRS